MGLSIKISFPIVTLLASQVASLNFTFPTPGKDDYVFANGDKAIVTWSPESLISELWLNCGPAPGKVNATGITATNAEAFYIYTTKWIQQEANHTYCKFCTGKDDKTCSGTFHLVDSKSGAAPKIWDVYREKVENNDCGKPTLAPGSGGKKNATSTSKHLSPTTTPGSGGKKNGTTTLSGDQGGNMTMGYSAAASSAAASFAAFPSAAASSAANSFVTTSFAAAASSGVVYSAALSAAHSAAASSTITASWAAASSTAVVNNLTSPYTAPSVASPASGSNASSATSLGATTTPSSIQANMGPAAEASLKLIGTLMIPAAIMLLL